jgi:hypothetical protein
MAKYLPTRVFLRVVVLGKVFDITLKLLDSRKGFLTGHFFVFHIVFLFGVYFELLNRFTDQIPTVHQGSPIGNLVGVRAGESDLIAYQTIEFCYRVA